MVGSADLARLTAHAEKARVKLSSVLVGDYEQLAEIEAGGLFRAVAGRVEPVLLDEVVRHRHAAEREGAKRIREGRGREAIALYRSEERVIVAPDADARREAMVSDWHEAHSRGEDAVMVAKRNAEAEALNELARERMREAGRLGAEEVEVGGQLFAAGDQVITRVNDRRAGIFNRERWRVVEANPAERRVVLEGLDQERAVEAGAGYLDRVNLGSGAPALQHAYAITTYSAQGATVDRAYVAVDGSMDKQELYVATSRSREETFLYATPEVRAERAEIAPAEPGARDELAHITEASVRDRAQVAAHEAAARAELSGPELSELRRRLRQRFEDLDKAGLERKLKWQEQRLWQVEREIAIPLDLGPAHEKEMRQERERLSAGVDDVSARLAKIGGPEERRAALTELAAVDAELAVRQRLRLAAVRLAPPGYLLAELGESPPTPVSASAGTGRRRRSRAIAWSAASWTEAASLGRGLRSWSSGLLGSGSSAGFERRRGA
jgi:hypothetical protein